MDTQLKPCPFCGGAPELIDSRVEYFVRCNHCKPFATVIYGNTVRHLDHIEGDEAAQKAFDAVDWEALKQSAIDAWNRRAVPSSVATDAAAPSDTCACGYSLETSCNVLDPTCKRNPTAQPDERAAFEDWWYAKINSGISPLDIAFAAHLEHIEARGSAPQAPALTDELLVTARYDASTAINDEDGELIGCLDWCREFAKLILAARQESSK